MELRISNLISRKKKMPPQRRSPASGKSPQNLTFVTDLYPEEAASSGGSGQKEYFDQETVEDHPIHPMFTKKIEPYYDRDPTKYLQLNCLDVYGHTAHCPLCNQFFACSKTPHILLIIVLLIVCVILFKKAYRD